MGKSPITLAQEGQDKLEEAILAVLETATKRGECLGPKEISNRTGIFREAGGGGDLPAAMNDAIVQGIIIKLYRARRVAGCKTPKNTKGYKLSPSELAHRGAE